ncbi:S-adenosyl-L-methionine-dependent methyltransferase [Calycina marina]|uniref:S-adenosyl-L-methionine-dependent methyltransferase n=1 Tax=Calycina marina TaxID=1763456 RepID=A0A9P7YU71_9HELO|nr:S-adenosyl-L-methionine-dependent methyltransferase [Calycina marina]
MGRGGNRVSHKAPVIVQTLITIGRGGEDNRVSFEKTPKGNAKLERYYNKILGLGEEEQAEFWAALKRELPNSFRFAGSKGHALAVQRQLVTRYIPEISKISHYDGTLVEPPQSVPWYPDALAWWMTTPKNVVRKFPPFSAFQKYLVSETSVGNISRQEVVSMIPPLVMDLQPGMIVLDMCAAPGSKAAQLLEMVHRGEEQRVHQSLRDYATEDGRPTSPGVGAGADLDEAALADTSDYGRATGLLIANDSDYKRSHMLIHQLKRLSSPNLIVTNHDATLYPSIKLPPTPNNPATNRYLKFDRILADVPCSGDGTTRKNVNLWKDWTPGSALGLYITQVRILVRALQMLKVGGRVVYSTCSMNPVENEAVIASAIERCGGLGKVELLPTSDKLPLLKRKPGLKIWAVMDKAARIWETFADVQKDDEENGRDAAKEKLVQNMFAPLPGSPGSEIPFERCMRVYAHQQDTGGFFITILEKKSEFRAKPEVESTSDAPKSAGTATPKFENSGSSVAGVPMLDGSLNGLKRGADAVEDREEQPSSPKKFKSESESAEVKPEQESVEVKSEPEFTDIAAKPVTEITPKSVDDAQPLVRSQHPPVQQRNRAGQQFEEPFKYIAHDHLEVKSVETFYRLSPRFPRDRFMVRNAQGEPAKTIYYTSALIRDILTENEGKGIKFIHGGVKMFMKQDVQGEGVCKWRIQSEGMPILEGYVGEERVVRLHKKETLKKLLIEMFPKLSGDAWKNLDEIGERVNGIGMGCCVLRVEPSADDDGFQERIVMPLWRSLHSLNLMLAKEDRTAMLLRVYNDTTPLVNSHNIGGKNKQEVREDEAFKLQRDVDVEEDAIMEEAVTDTVANSNTLGGTITTEAATELDSSQAQASEAEPAAE